MLFLFWNLLCTRYLDHPVKLGVELLGEQAGEHGPHDLAQPDPEGHAWMKDNNCRRRGFKTKIREVVFVLKKLALVPTRDAN